MIREVIVADYLSAAGLTARTRVPLLAALARHLQRPRNVSSSVL